MTIQVLLIQNVTGVGRKGEIIDVRRGYARNFLLSQGLARIANEKDAAAAEREKTAVEKRKEEELLKLKDIKTRLFKKRITIALPANEQGTLYGGVASKDIADALYTTYGVDLPISSIIVGTIKTVGLHAFKVAVKEQGEIAMKARVRAL